MNGFWDIFFERLPTFLPILLVGFQVSLLVAAGSVVIAMTFGLFGEVLAVMRDLAHEGMTMLVVTHEIRFAAEVADRILFMDRGRIVADGPPRQVLYEQPTDRMRQFLRSLSTDVMPGGSA